ncbi:ImmA/IrrE family metallo-endopeptidase [Pseudomonas resinovorans]|uniref:ImmA/IrrE family metallo-endopeptidase n=1 Tax=Metapseudomonas resinovorans TaxID=53412 RepID=A0ABT4Y477_METRE|nr:ImmA/IrrE family metallo-endopeptidase [Pseudomonas resinovorans]MDA8483661.1 ImmA/IrrE family metallo-endopeptidase [Pseudomonas resinovorans]
MAFIRRKSSDMVKAPIVSEGQFSAEQVRSKARELGIGVSPLDVQALTKALGIDFLCVPMDDDISGSLTAYPDRQGWVMKVNSLHHPNRQRFTIAHELGHYFKHRNAQVEFVDQNFFRNSESNWMEAEANSFAGELLMPEAEFREKVRVLGGSIEDVAQSFSVSTFAVRVRAKILGMKGHGLE